MNAPLLFLAWDKNCNNFFGPRIPSPICRSHDCCPLPAALAASGGRKGATAGRKRRLLLFTYSAQAACSRATRSDSSRTNREQPGDKHVTLAARVMLRSFITSSNAAVSSACFWLCKAIFSLNFRGLFEVAMFRSSAPFSFNGQRQGNSNED